LNLSTFLKQQRRVHKLTQEDLALKAGVGLRLIREMEQGKTTMQMDKVNQVLSLFGAELSVTPKSPNHG
jgi:y4mF family transcriptional regulator